jgi:hypothetical protein
MISAIPMDLALFLRCHSPRRHCGRHRRVYFRPDCVGDLVAHYSSGPECAAYLETLRLFWIGLPAEIIGTWLGFKLYGRLDEAKFRIVVLVLLLASGLTLLPWTSSRGG